MATFQPFGVIQMLRLADLVNISRCPSWIRYSGLLR